MIKKDFFEKTASGDIRSMSSHDRYRFKILLILFSLSTMIALYLLAGQYYHNRSDLLPLYLFFSCCLGIMTICLVIFKKIRLMVNSALFLLYAIFFISLYIKDADEIYILISLNYIPLAFSLAGSRAGAWWVSCFILSFAAAWAGTGTGLLPAWNIIGNHEFIAVSLISFLAMSCIVLASRLHHDYFAGRLAKSVVFDRVTGLPGKEYFIKNMRNVENSIIAIIHIINFRGLSSLFGYEFSDSILVVLSDMLKADGAAAGFSVYKLAWHEFGLQIPVNRDITPEEAESILKDVIEKVRGTRTKWGQTEISIAICAGGIIVRDYGYDRAISGADAALVTGLKTHRSVTIFNESMDVKVAALDVVTRFTDLHDNISQGTLKSYLQPVVHTDTGDVCWHEALLRIKGSDGVYGSVYPYLDVAKDTGLYPHLTEFMLKKCGEIIKNTGLSISVNVCLRDMLNSSVLDQVAGITSMKEYSPGRLILEIVESEDIQDVESCFEFIHRVKGMGVSIAIDDFGSGYSNYSNLLSMGVDIVKIDGALIRRLEHDDDAEVLINGIVNFCKNAERKIVAEYVENSWLLEKLAEMKVNYCQGYLFGKPFDPDGEKA